jgi:hypothetical protein
MEQGKEQRGVTSGPQSRSNGAADGVGASEVNVNVRSRLEQVSRLFLLFSSNRRNGIDGRGYCNKKQADAEQMFIGLVCRPMEGRPDGRPVHSISICAQRRLGWTKFARI